MKTIYIDKTPTKRKNIFNETKGSVLIWTLIAFTVLTVIISSILFLVNQNIFETTKQEDRLQAYYIALSGIDLTYAALMEPSYHPKKIETAIQKLKTNSTPLKDNIVIKIGGVEKGTATVTIDRFKENDINWLKITSVGKLKDKDVTVSSTMKINEDNHNQVIREK